MNNMCPKCGELFDWDPVYADNMALKDRLKAVEADRDRIVKLVEDAVPEKPRWGFTFERLRWTSLLKKIRGT